MLGGLNYKNVLAYCEDRWNLEPGCWGFADSARGFPSLPSQGRLKRSSWGWGTFFYKGVNPIYKGSLPTTITSHTHYFLISALGNYNFYLWSRRGQAQIKAGPQQPQQMSSREARMRRKSGCRGRANEGHTQAESSLCQTGSRTQSWWYAEGPCEKK